MRRNRQSVAPVPPTACGHLHGDTMDPRPARVWTCNDCGCVIGVAVVTDARIVPADSPDLREVAEEIAREVKTDVDRALRTAFPNARFEVNRMHMADLIFPILTRHFGGR